MEKNNSGDSLRLILPAKGRLKDDFNPVLADAGFRFTRQGERIDRGMTHDRRGDLLAIETALERADDALQSLADGAADLALVGRDTYLEFNRAARAQNPRFPANNVQVVLTLETVSACEICIAGPRALRLEKESDLQGLRIATSLPAILTHWLAARNITPGGILLRSGGTEATIAQGRADVICDLVRTGDTLEANGLERKFDVESRISAVVACRVGLWLAPQAALARAMLQRLEEAVSPARAGASGAFRPGV